MCTSKNGVISVAIQVIQLYSDIHMILIHACCKNTFNTSLNQITTTMLIYLVGRFCCCFCVVAEVPFYFNFEALHIYVEFYM